MKIGKFIVRQKIILDRGKLYFGYIQMISTALILVGVFGIKKWYWAGGIITLFIISTYIMGLLDNNKVLNEEQKQYSEKNPVLMEILKKLNELEKK